MLLRRPSICRRAVGAHLGAERLAEGRQAARQLLARFALGAPRAHQDSASRPAVEIAPQGEHQEDLDHAYTNKPEKANVSTQAVTSLISNRTPLRDGRLL